MRGLYTIIYLSFSLVLAKKAPEGEKPGMYFTCFKMKFLILSVGCKNTVSYDRKII